MRGGIGARKSTKTRPMGNRRVDQGRPRVLHDSGRLRRGLILLRWLIDPYRSHDAWNLYSGSVASRNFRNRCSVLVCPTSHSHTTSTCHPSACSAAKCS